MPLFSKPLDVFSCPLHLSCFSGPVSVLHAFDRDIQGQSEHESFPDKRATFNKSVIFFPLARIECETCAMRLALHVGRTVF